MFVSLFFGLADAGDVPIRWYPFDAQAPWYECPTGSFPPAATVVTAFDQEYHYYGSVNKRSITKTVTFPAAGPWSQIGLYLDLECPASTLCDHWDRTGSVQLVLNPEDDPVDWEYLELIRFITPYRVEMCQYVDVTRLAPLLVGEQTLVSWIDTWVGPGHSSGEGWRLTVKFVFYPGPQGGPDEVINIWGRRSITVGYLDPARNVDSQIDPVTVSISPHAAKVEARVIATGHSFGHSLNCAEFCQLRQDVYVNGTMFSVNQWRNDCEHNPVSPQFGTWEYDRNGWCPGAIQVGDIIDITSDIIIGDSNIIDYDIRRPSGAEYENVDHAGGGDPHEWISLQLYVFNSRPDVPNVPRVWILPLLFGCVLLISIVVYLKK
jgi:hypothetical protein